jgi:alkylhydroperoxidase family enzyme
VILRVSQIRGSDYEFDHHTRLGRRAGVDDELRARIVEGPGAQGLTPRERTMLTAVDELVAIRDLSDETWTALSELLNPRRLIEFTLLVTQYDGLATTIRAFRIQRDSFRK